MLHFDLFGEKFPARTKKINYKGTGHRPAPKVQVSKAVKNLGSLRTESEVQYIGQNIYIRPNYIVSLPEYDRKRNFNTQKFNDNKKNLLHNSHKGKVSAKAQKEIKTAVNWLVASAKLKQVYHKPTKKMHSFKVNFITLTLPDTPEPISEKSFKEDLLNPFLTNLRKSYGLNNYVWKLELQQNGKIHAHITTDSFLHWSDLRRLWNVRLIKCGYMQLFKDTFGHTNPNSTDVHAVYKVKDIAAYISKYMSKDADQATTIKGKIWACNYELSRNCKPKVFIDRNNCHIALRSLMQKEIKFKPVETLTDALGTSKKIGDMFLLKPINWLMHIKGEIKQIYSDTCWRIRNLVDITQPVGLNDYGAPVLSV
jgi:hypothetical protein